MPQAASVSLTPVLEAFKAVENAESKPSCASCGIDFMSVYHAVYNLVTHGQAEAVYNEAELFLIRSAARALKSTATLAAHSRTVDAIFGAWEAHSARGELLCSFLLYLDARFSSKERRAPTPQLVAKSFREALLALPGAAEALYGLALAESLSGEASSESLRKALRLLESLSADRPAFYDELFEKKLLSAAEQRFRKRFSAMRRELKPAELLKGAEAYCAEQRAAWAAFRADTAGKMAKALQAALREAVLVPVAEDRENGLASFFAAQRADDVRRFLALDAAKATGPNVAAAAKAFIEAETAKVAACAANGDKKGGPKPAAEQMANVSAAQRKIERALVCLGEPGAWWRYSVRGDPHFLPQLARFVDGLVRQHSAADMAAALAAKDVATLLLLAARAPSFERELLCAMEQRLLESRDAAADKAFVEATASLHSARFLATARRMSADVAQTSAVDGAASVIVCTPSAWPMLDEGAERKSFAWPPELKRRIDRFAKEFCAGSVGRRKRLEFFPNFNRLRVSIAVRNKKIAVEVNAFEAVVLLHFNRFSEAAYDALAEATGLEKTAFDAAVQRLLSLKILNASFSDSADRGVNGNENLRGAVFVLAGEGSAIPKR